MIISNLACDTVEDVIPYVVITVFTMYVALNSYNVVITYALLYHIHSLIENKIGDVGAQSLAEGLSHCTNLESLK